MTVEIKKLEKSRVEITGEIPADIFEQHRKRAVEKLGSKVSIDGFRKGHVPENILIKEIGEQTIMETAAQSALQEQYPRIVKEHGVDVIGQPEVTVTKMAPNNPLGFRIIVAVMPKCTLPDYRKIAQKHNANKENIEVSEKEVEDTIQELRKMHAQKNSASGTDTPEQREVGENDLPPLTDEFVQSLGNFKTVEEFKEKLRENIAFEKERKAQERRRIAMMDDIIADTSMELPDIVIQAEQQKMLAQFKADLETMGTSYDDYLKEVKKTEGEILDELRNEAIKRAKTQIILNAIAEQENISIPEDVIKKEVDEILKRYQDADRDRATVYVTTALTNAKVFELLESGK